MTLWRADPERAADALIEASIDDFALPPAAQLLLVNQAGQLPALFARRGHEVTVWNRRLGQSFAASATPPEGPFDAALLRMPKAKDELEMSAHLAAARLRPGGQLIVYGGNDEGMRTAARRLVSLSDACATLATRGHGRVIALQPAPMERLRGDLQQWRQVSDAGLATYPGLFAAGTIDAGTALLLDVMAREPIQPKRILDFGCGPGAIARSLRARFPDAGIEALDHDAVALVAVAETVAAVTPVLAADLTGLDAGAYDLIVSNPPIHTGIREDHATLEHLIAAAPRCLTPTGQLVIVVQRRVPLAELFAKQFRSHDIAAESGTYRIWRGRL